MFGEGLAYNGIGRECFWEQNGLERRVSQGSHRADCSLISVEKGLSGVPPCRLEFDFC